MLGLTQKIAMMLYPNNDRIYLSSLFILSITESSSKGRRFTYVRFRTRSNVNGLILVNFLVSNRLDRGSNNNNNDNHYILSLYQQLQFPPLLLLLLLLIYEWVSPAML